MVFRVMSQVSEVKVHGIGDADFALRHSESFHEVHGVGVGSVGGSEAGHGDADNSSSVTLEAVKSVDGNQERECGVKSSADAEGDGFGFGVFNSSGESFALNEKNLLTAGGTKFVKYFAGIDFVSEGDLYKNFGNGRNYDTGYNYNRVNVRSNLDFSITKTTLFKVNLAGSNNHRIFKPCRKICNGIRSEKQLNIVIR